MVMDRAAQRARALLAPGAAKTRFRLWREAMPQIGLVRPIRRGASSIPTRAGRPSSIGDPDDRRRIRLARLRPSRDRKTGCAEAWDEALAQGAAAGDRVSAFATMGAINRWMLARALAGTRCDGGGIEHWFGTSDRYPRDPRRPRPKLAMSEAALSRPHRSQRPRGLGAPQPMGGSSTAPGGEEITGAIPRGIQGRTAGLTALHPDDRERFHHACEGTGLPNDRPRASHYRLRFFGWQLTAGSAHAPVPLFDDDGGGIARMDRHRHRCA